MPNITNVRFNADLYSKLVSDAAKAGPLTPEVLADCMAKAAPSDADCLKNIAYWFAKTEEAMGAFLKLEKAYKEAAMARSNAEKVYEEEVAYAQGRGIKGVENKLRGRWTDAAKAEFLAKLEAEETIKDNKPAPVRRPGEK